MHGDKNIKNGIQNIDVANKNITDNKEAVASPIMIDTTIAAINKVIPKFLYCIYLYYIYMI